jgi:hypothetical protein
MAELLIQYSTSVAFASGIIRRLTHSRFSHVDIVIPNEGLLGVSGPDCGTTVGVEWRRQHGMSHDIGGVRIRDFHPWPYMSPPKVAHLQTSDVVVQSVHAWGRAQIGVPFDSKALYHFLRDRGGLKTIHRDWRDPAQWFCSEFVIRAAEIGGLFTYPLAVEKDVISPNDTLLIFNQFMTAESTAEFI